MTSTGITPARIMPPDQYSTCSVSWKRSKFAAELRRSHRSTCGALTERRGFHSIWQKNFGCDCCCGIFAATSGRDYLLSPAG